jgi:hypothetical protein
VRAARGAQVLNGVCFGGAAFKTCAAIYYMEITIKVEGGLRKKYGVIRLNAGEGRRLDPGRVRRVLYDIESLYVTYETERADYYKQYEAVPRPWAVEIPFRVRKYEDLYCTKHKTAVEWDADEPFCPVGGERCSDYWEKKTMYDFDADIDSGTKRVLEKIFNAEVLAFERYMAGGTYISSGFREEHEAKFAAADGTSVLGWGIAEGPELKTSYWDEPDVTVRRLEGEYFVLKTSTGSGEGVRYYLARMGQQNQELFSQFLEWLRGKEEEYRKVKEEERRRREEAERRWEEERKRREEELNKMTLEDAVRELLKMKPQWADGLYIYARGYCFEDCDVEYVATPVKKRQDGYGYYFKKTWKSYFAEEDVVKKFGLNGTVITSDGRALRVKEAREEGDYVYLTV